MKRLLLLLPVMLLTLALTGCFETFNPSGRSILSGGTSIVAPITNPVSPTNIYQVKLTFNLTVKAANKWASYCWSTTYKQLMADPVASRVCENRRQTRRTLIAAADRSDAAIKSATTFIRNNPTISPFSVIDDAWKAVVDYKSLVAQVSP